MAARKKIVKASKKYRTLKDAVRFAVESSGLPATELSRQAGLKPFRIPQMSQGAVQGIQKDLALKLARLAKVDPSIFEPFLSDRVPHGARKRRMERKEKRLESVFLVTCPCCEGEGKINVRKV